MEARGEGLFVCCSCLALLWIKAKALYLLDVSLVPTIALKVLFSRPGTSEFSCNPSFQSATLLYFRALHSVVLETWLRWMTECRTDTHTDGYGEVGMGWAMPT